MTGFLVPPWYQASIPTDEDRLLASTVWGFSMATSIFTAIKGIRQTATSWKRMKRVSAYVVMIWVEWLACLTQGVLCWLYLRGVFEPSFQLFFSFACIWAIQVQLLLQIIINRISLLMVCRSEATRLKLAVAIILGLIDISVFCIWIPAQLQISETFHHINEIWDRIEKAIFGLIDGSLNLYFIHLTRKELVNFGLSKYELLFRLNILMVCISLSLDAILIGVMSLPLRFMFVQFHPLAYLIKLHIEMTNADLIAKIAKATNVSDYSLSDACRSPGENGWRCPISREHCGIREPLPTRLLQNGVLKHPLQPETRRTVSSTAVLEVSRQT